MWGFFSNLLESGGVVAVLFAAVFIAFSLVVRALWNTNQSLNKQIREIHKEYLREIATLHERRVSEAQSVTETVVRAVDSTARGMEKVEKTMDLLIDLSGNRGGRR